MILSLIKDVIEKKLYHTMDIYIYENVENDGLFSSEKKMLYEDIPCFLYKQDNSVDDDSVTLKNVYFNKIFFSSDISIPSGSYISVYILGVKRDFVMSGEMIIYKTHNEIMVKRDEYC